MDFQLSKAQQLQRDLFRRFAEKEIRPIAREMDETETYSMDLLEKMQDRPARWYFYMANAHMGLGNDVAALNYAQQAVSREPDNLEYRQLLQRLQYAGQTYRQTGRRYGMSGLDNTCTWLCLGNLLLSCCCGRGGYFFCC